MNAERELGKCKMVRLICVLLILFFPCLFVLSGKFYFSHPSVSRWLLVATASFFVYGWYYYDREIHDYQKIFWISVMIIAIPLIGVPIHLVKTRKPAKSFLYILFAVSILFVSGALQTMAIMHLK